MIMFITVILIAIFAVGYIWLSERDSKKTPHTHK